MDEVDRAQALEALQLRVALSKIEAPDKGLHKKNRCEDCGEPIGRARLKALPAARRCIDCQAAYERERRC